jgi:hypothetical protein
MGRGIDTPPRLLTQRQNVTHGSSAVACGTRGAHPLEPMYTQAAVPLRPGADWRLAGVPLRGGQKKMDAGTKS